MQSIFNTEKASYSQMCQESFNFIILLRLLSFLSSKNEAKKLPDTCDGGSTKKIITQLIKYVILSIQTSKSTFQRQESRTYTV